MEPTYEDYEKRAMPTGIILTQHSWDKLSPQGRVNLLAVLPTLEQRAELEQLTADTPHVGPLSAEQLAELRLVVDEERTSHDGTPFAKLGFWPSKVDALLNALAAAEARATEAAAEAGKWQAEARAHAARCAVLEKADAAPYCEGQCGICDCETAPVAPKVGFGPEDGWIADLLSGTIPVEGQPAAPAPVAQQQQEGGGQ